MFSARILVLASLAVVAQVASAADCVRSYTVKEGDFCDKISTSNSVSTYQLAAINPGTINEACSNLIIGSTICLGTAGEDCTETYTVQRGDNCYKIYDTFGVNSTIFNLNNPQVNAGCTNIYTGQVVCVDRAVKVPAHPGVPIHIAPVPGPQPTAIPASEASSIPTPVAVVNVAPTPVKSSPAPATTTIQTGASDEECEEYEVVPFDAGDEIPFCDDL